MTVERAAELWFRGRQKLKAALLADLGKEIADQFPAVSSYTPNEYQPSPFEIRSLILSLRLLSHQLRSAMRRDGVSEILIPGARIQVDWNTGQITLAN